MSALTILLSPGEHADGVIAGLTDLSAAGLINEFGWIRCVAGSSRIEKVTLVTEGRSTDVSLEQLVTGRQIPALRVATLVPATPDAVPADLGTEIAAANGLVSVSGAMSVTRVRFLLAGPEGIAGDLDSLVIEGYHNVLVSPEDSRAPAFGRIATPTSPGPQEFARFAAPAVAGVTGLWSGVAHAPLDGVDPLPGRVVRLTRSFYRRLRTDDVEKRLRSVILAQNGELPLPSDQHSQVIYVQDPGLAASTMAQAFWTKHAAVLRSNLLPYEAVTTEEIGGWKAITMFFGFLWASLKNAPSAWYRSLVDNVSDRVAIGIQNAVFTDAPAAYEVVVRGRKANGEYASWDDVGAATEHLAAIAGIGQTESAQADLSVVWQDYASASFTLADGGTRGVSGGLPPIQVGAARGVIGHSGSIVPGARERFSDIPGVVAAAVRTDGVDATDPLGIQDLRFQLHELQASPDHGLAAGSALKQLDGWAATTSRSFGSLVGERLATSYGEARRDMQNLFEKVRNAAAAPDPGEAKLTLARWTQVLVILWLVLTGVFIWLGVRGTVEWWVPVSVIVGTLVILLMCLCMAFIKSQRQLFALLHQRRRQKSEEAVDLQNLQTLISDVRRLWQAYGQFLSWSRAIGSFLSAPLGPDREQPTTPLDVAWGLPMSTSIGVAQPADEQVSQASGHLRRALYHPGWLTNSWDDLILRTSPPGPGQQPSALASPLWHDRGRQSQSGLERWSDDLFSGRLQSSGADVVWRNALELLSTSMHQLVPNLVGTVSVIGGPVQPLAEFLGDLDREQGARGTFAHDILTDGAIADAAAEVSVDHRRPTRKGLGIICAATQYSDAFTIDRLRTAGGTVQETWDAPTLSEPYSGAAPAGPTQPEPEAEFRAPDFGKGFGF